VLVRSGLRCVVAEHFFRVSVHQGESGEWLEIHVPEIDGLTQARKADEIEQAAKELIAVTLGVPIDDVSVAVTING
jgi:hypothetical protein